MHTDVWQMHMNAYGSILTHTRYQVLRARYYVHTYVHIIHIVHIRHTMHIVHILHTVQSVHYKLYILYILYDQYILYRAVPYRSGGAGGRRAGRRPTDGKSSRKCHQVAVAFVVCVGSV